MRRQKKAKGSTNGSCKSCGKVIFRDELAAKIALAGRLNRDRGEVRCYRCPQGRGWHLTSKK